MGAGERWPVAIEKTELGGRGLEQALSVGGDLRSEVQRVDEAGECGQPMVHVEKWVVVERDRGRQIGAGDAEVGVARERPPLVERLAMASAVGQVVQPHAWAR